ncbi:MAG: DNA repair protein RecN [Alphaproteobacteria bacterium]|nr:DNA repair protein RecN [Alphaproteobacteria bacterium]
MLESLSVRNFVLIEKLDVDFTSGFTILSGETGAGKSILLGALGLVMGNRADVDLIRNGTDKLSVTATFSAPSSKSNINTIAKENDIEIDGSIIIKRSLSADGKSKIFINDQPVSLKLLKEFASELVEIHGQFDNQGLLNQANHIGILDNYGNYPAKLEQVKNFYNQYKQAVNNRIKALQQLEHSRQEEDNLKAWVDELQKLKPVLGEEESLSKRRTEIMNSEKIMESFNLAYSSLTQEYDIFSSIRRAENAISRINNLLDNKYGEIADTLEQSIINLDESVRQIEDATAGLSYNANEADQIEQRLFALRSAARKHQVSIDDLPQKLQEMQEKLATIENGEDNLLELSKIEEKMRLQYLQSAKELSKLRHQAASKLDEKVMAELPPLKMEKATFITKIEELPESQWNSFGTDNVSFTVSTNPNSPQGPLNKIASGGELARFMLALKVNLAADKEQKTMIFDEVDAGIGGATAQAVGTRLRDLAEKEQVLVVTHSPQVAACGQSHFKVFKQTENNITTTYITLLSSKEREEEIARMLAGEKISDEARAAAKVLIKS